MNAPETVSQQIARILSPDPCIIMGCIHDYGHEGPHEIDADAFADAVHISVTEE